MKKFLLVTILLLALALGGLYIFIPNHITISTEKKLAVSREALMRTLATSSEWPKWWPGTIDTAAGILQLNGHSYTMAESRVYSIPVTIAFNEERLPAEIICEPRGTDSCTLKMVTKTITSYNPFKRIAKYRSAEKLRSDFAGIMAAIEKMAHSPQSVYDYVIKKELVVDSILLTNIREIKGKPGYEFIYQMVDELKAYIREQGAAEKGYPMLNVFTKDSLNYLVKVAIPTDKKLPDRGTIVYRWMLGGGNILITEVKGGPEAIKKAYHQVELYISDYRRVAPAIPFESLVTDRRAEKDSAKWITRIYYPVM